MRTKKILVSCLTILALMVTVVAGAVFASPMQQRQNTDGSLGYIPESGIRWNPGAKNFEVYNYAGFTQIGGGKFVSSTGEVSNTGTDSATVRQATMSDSYSIMQDVAYEESDAAITRSTASFKGTLDGRGMNLVGFPMQSVGNMHYGLFYDNQGTIRNVNFLNPTFGAMVKDDSVGVLVYRNSGSIIDSTVRTVLKSTTGIHAGGFVYSAQSGTLVEGCKFEGEIGFGSTGNVGGIIGDMASGANVTLRNTVNSADLSGIIAVGLAGGRVVNSAFKAYNCSTVGVVIGTTVKYNFSYLDKGTIQNCYGRDDSESGQAGLAYSIRYHANGGAFEGSDTLTAVGDTLMANVWTGVDTVLPVATKSGWNFIGWYTDPGFNAATLVTTVNSLNAKNGFVTVYARFSLGTIDGRKQQCNGTASGNNKANSKGRWLCASRKKCSRSKRGIFQN